MGRVIKFRAWDKREQKMFNVDVLAISACTWDCPDHNTRGLSLAYQPDTPIMQSTGLLDKDGKEIYEEHELNNSYGVRFEDGCYILYNIPTGDRFMTLNEVVINAYGLKITREYTKVEKD